MKSRPRRASQEVGDHSMETQYPIQSTDMQDILHSKTRLGVKRVKRQSSLWAQASRHSHREVSNSLQAVHTDEAQCVAGAVQAGLKTYRAASVAWCAERSDKVLSKRCV